MKKHLFLVWLLTTPLWAVNNPRVLSVPVLAVTNNTLSVREFGALPNDGVDDTSAIQLAINAAIANTLSFDGSRRIGQRLEIPPGEYLLSNTLEVINAYQLNISGDSGGVAFIWQGTNNIPAFRFVNAYQCKSENFRIRVNVGYTLYTGVEQYTDIGFGTNYYTIGTRNSYKNVNMESTSGQLTHGWRIGGVAGGLLGVVLGDDANNDFTSWEGCAVLNHSAAGWILEGFNCFENQFQNCQAVGWTGSTNTNIGVYSFAANYHWIRGGMTYQASCFKNESSSSAVSEVDGADIELSGKLLDSGLSTGAAQWTKLNNIRFAAAVPVDGKVITWYKAGTLQISGLRIENVGQSGSFKIDIQNNYRDNCALTIVDSFIVNDDGIIFPSKQPDRVENVVVYRNGVSSRLNNLNVGPANDLKGTINAFGGAEVTPLVPLNPSNAFFTGTGGSTTYSYKVTVTSDMGESLPAVEFSVTNCSSALTVNNYNTFWFLWPTHIPGAKTYKLYRTVPSNQQALVATLSGTTFPLLPLLIDDGSVVGSSSPSVENTPPTYDSSGIVTIASALGINGTPTELQKIYIVNSDNAERQVRMDITSTGTNASGGYYGVADASHYFYLKQFGTGHATLPGWTLLFTSGDMHYYLGASTNIHYFTVAGITRLEVNTSGIIASGTASVTGNITNGVLTANRVVGTDANKALVSSPNVDMNEINYLDNTTTNIATTFVQVANQLATKLDKAGILMMWFAASDETTALTTGDNKIRIRAPRAFTATSIRASVGTVSSSGPVTVDINESGSTILSTKVTIDQSEKTSLDAAQSVISDSAIADDAEITIDIDAAGTGAAGLKIQIYGTP